MKTFAQWVGHYVEHIWRLELVAEQCRLDDQDTFGYLSLYMPLYALPFDFLYLEGIIFSETRMNQTMGLDLEDVDFANVISQECNK